MPFKLLDKVRTKRVTYHGALTGIVIGFAPPLDSRYNILVILDNWQRGHNGRHDVLDIRPPLCLVLGTTDNCWWFREDEIKCL